MKINFNERVAVITGAGAGLGRSYALELASRGAKVVVNDIGSVDDSLSRAQRVVDEIRSAGGEALPNCDDISERSGASRIVDETMDSFGRLDILINNAGTLRDRSFMKMTLDDFEEIIRIHLLGSVAVTKRAFPIMRDQGYGRIILTTSAAGLYGNFGQTNYAAAKLGLVGFMNALKLEGSKYNINVNTVAPIAATGLSKGIFPETVTEKITPEFVAAMVVYLASDACTATGQILSAGGGYYAAVQIVEGAGIRFEHVPVTAEMIAQQFENITSMEHSRHYENASENVIALLQPLMNG